MLILTVLLHAGSSPHFAPHPFTVVNGTHQNIEGVWEGAHTRGGGDQVNYLGTDGREGQPGIYEFIAPGKAHTFKNELEVNRRCRADLRVTFQDESERIWRNVDLCRLRRWVVRPN